MPLNAACRPNDAQIVPRRRNSQPSARATGMREPKPTTASPNASVGVGPAIVRTWAKAKTSARGSAGLADAQAATQAVVANARNRISSPNGATIDAGQQRQREPDGSPVGGSGLTGVTGKMRSRTPRDDGRHDDDRDRPQRAAGPSRRTAGRSSRRTPIARQSRAPVSTTSRRTSAT